jgi:phage tail-like protein
MRLPNISAAAHPDGNRIELTWANPDPVPAGYQLQIVRREHSYPDTPTDGAVVTPPTGASAYSDKGLRGETTYYYTFFPESDTEPAQPDARNQVAAMASAPYDIGGLMYGLLPEIYRRYDTATVLSGPAATRLRDDDRDHGMLRRFLDVTGNQFDQLYSLARAALRLHDIDHVDGALLPLLAQWIGWHIDHAAALATQRNEIRFAPWLYQGTGTAPTIAATTQRLTGRGCRLKEYVYNVARTNVPERLNLWTSTRTTAGQWGAPELLSVNFAYEGRAAAVRGPDNASTLLLYHTYRRHGWDVWCKRLTRDGWSASEPLVDRRGVDKNPTAAFAGDTLWVFWQTSNPSAGDGRWRIAFRTFAAPANGGADTAWSETAVFGDPDSERRAPVAVADDGGGLWLFWQERVDGRWRLRYNRHDGTHWQLDDPGDMPAEADEPATWDEDLAVLFHSGAAMPRLWLVWTRRQYTADGDSWSLVYRTKNGIDPATNDWSAESALPSPPAGVHDREPAVRATADGIELYFSSTRLGGWSILTTRLDHAANTWASVGPVVNSPFTDRAPTVIGTDDATILVYRSNRSLSYSSGATLDTRYGGTTTVLKSDAAKFALRGAYADFQTYTYDTRGTARPARTASSRDTIGVSVHPPPEDADADEVQAAVARLAAVLPEYLPITAHALVLDETRR